MSIVRLVVACLLMAALPLQGFAAASMLFCGQAEPASSQAPHDHASHGHGDSQAGHEHEADGHPGGAATHVADASLDHHAGVGTAEPSGDAHNCAVCASCGNLAALAPASILSLSEAALVTPADPGPARVPTREAPAPDKPPRG